MRGASTGGTESALAQIDVPMNGHIVGIEWACNADFDTDNDSQTWQLSFGSVNVDVNDSRQVISTITVGFMTFTAGGSVVAKANGFTMLPDIPVGMGERLFLHSLAAAGVVGVARLVIHFDFDLDQMKVRRR
jgi:hypothetical protein